MREESNRCQHFPLPRTTRATRFYPLEMALVKSVPPPSPPLLLFSTFPQFDSVRPRNRRISPRSQILTFVKLIYSNDSEEMDKLL